MRTYHEGQTYGIENLFIQNYFPSFTLISKGSTFVKLLKYDDFIELIKGHPSDYEQFCYLRDEFIYNG